MDIRPLLEVSYEKNYRRWYNRLNSRNVTHEMVEDSIQSACVKALRLSDAYDPTRNFNDWFQSILTNCLKDVIADDKKQGVTTTEPEDILDSSNVSPWLKRLMGSVSEDIAQLPQPRRDICHHYYVLGKTPREVSEDVGVSSNSVRSIIKRYKKVLEDKYDR